MYLRRKKKQGYTDAQEAGVRIGCRDIRPFKSYITPPNPRMQPVPEIFSRPDLLIARIPVDHESELYNRSASVTPGLLGC